MSETNSTDKFLLGRKRKGFKILTLEDIHAMEQKTNDEYENSEQDMIIEENSFNINILNHSLFIPIGNGQYILDYEKIQKNTNLILPKSLYEHSDSNYYSNWSCADFKNYFKEHCSNYYEQKITN